MSKPAVIKIGFCGLGTVGQGVWKHLLGNSAALEARLGTRLELAKVAVRDVRKARAVEIPADRLVSDPFEVARDPEIPIVCELIGGTQVAREVTLAALAAGKIVVSANKALICECGAEIFRAARAGHGHFFFEASVAGGVPIIKALREGLVANRFRRIYGILNGTCNYILTRMELEGAPYAEVVADAKRLGYAEADESLDVEGWDTAHKAAILAFLAHGIWVQPKQMLLEGITRLDPTDIHHAAQLGYRIKLLAVIHRDFAANELFVRVHPTLIPKRLVLANVDGVNNGIAVTGDVVGTTLYIGRGAGQDATASAVISDIADAVSLLTTGQSVVVPDEAATIHATGLPGVHLAPLDHVRSRYYLRMLVRDQPGVLAQIATVMAQNRVSIESVIQRGAGRPDTAMLILTTHQSDEQAARTTVAGLVKLESVLEPPLLLPIGDFEE
jgi:homoserine dehydrogenase